MYDLNGNLLWTVGSALSGLGLPYGVKFSQDGSYVVVAESNSDRVTRWSSISGAYISTVATTVKANDVVECDTGSGTGSVIADFGNSRLARISEAGVATTLSNVNTARSLVLVPGRGILIILINLNQVVLMSSVAILTQPVSATVVVGSTATFAVALTANSASTELTYVWSKGGMVVGTNSASYTYTAVDVEGGLTFAVVCTVTHAIGLVVSNSAALTVQVRKDEVYFVLFRDSKQSNKHPSA
jgi:hypothetical protein